MLRKRETPSTRGLRNAVLFSILLGLPAGAHAGGSPELRLALETGDSLTYRTTCWREMLVPQEGTAARSEIVSGTFMISVTGENPDGSKTLRAELLVVPLVQDASGGIQRGPEVISATLSLTMNPQGGWGPPEPTEDAPPVKRLQANTLRTVLWGLYICLPSLPPDEGVRSLPRPTRWATKNAWGGETMEVVSEPRGESTFLLATHTVSMPDSSVLFMRITSELKDGRIVEGQMVRSRISASGGMLYKDLVDITLVSEQRPAVPG